MTAIRPMFGTGTINGNLVALAATSTTLHTAGADTDHIDEIYVYACCIHTADVVVTVEIDGTAAGNQMKYTVPKDDGFHLIVPGIRMENAGTVKAKGATADVINCIVIVNRLVDPDAI